MRRPVREGTLPYDGRARAGEVGLRRSTCEPPNKGGQLPAEVGEGRAQLEENIGQAHMPLTRAGNTHVPVLGGVRVTNRSSACSHAIHPSEFFRRAVCVKRARKDLCGGAIREDRPYRDRNAISLALPILPSERGSYLV